MLRKANDSLQKTTKQYLKKIQELKSDKREKSDEKEITEQITNELIEKIESYEQAIEELRSENESLRHELDVRVDQSHQIAEYQNLINEFESMKETEVNRKITEIKEDFLIKESENSRLKEKNENMHNQIMCFKKELDGLQDYINLKEDQIRNKFRDEEVCVCIQLLLKELISVSRQQALNFLGIEKNVKKEDINKLIKNHYLTDAYVRFVLVNSVAYLQECKESLNYLKQKYAESELKYDNIIEKYQICKNEKNCLHNTSVIQESNMHKLMVENQKLNEEKFQILQSCMQNQSRLSSPAFINSYDSLALKNLTHEKENISAFVEESNLNFSKLPLSNRLQKNTKMSVDQSQILSERMSQNLSIHKNSSVISNRIS
jgi:hypothetical protein